MCPTASWMMVRLKGRSGYFEGRSELAKLGMTATQSLLPRHIVSNVLITPHKDMPDHAGILSHLLFYEVTPEGFNFKTSGVYTDVVRKCDDGWKFVSRVMKLDVAMVPNET